ncbi:MAG: class I SAM-dependent methyltransferase [Hyphomicrobiaceae bacterium]
MSIHATGFIEQHARRMDDIYRRQRHIYDATRRYFLLGRKDLIEGLAPPPGGSVLEVGCGTAWNLIEAAERHRDSQLYGLDISSVMLATEERKIAAAGLSTRIQLAEADATTFRPTKLFGRASFDRVFISYALSMIPGWRDAVDRAARMLSAGSELHIVDFGRCEDLPRPFRTALHAWLARFSVEPRRDLEPAIARIAARLDLEPTFVPLYRGYATLVVLRTRTNRQDVRSAPEQVISDRSAPRVPTTPAEAAQPRHRARV